MESKVTSTMIVAIQRKPIVHRDGDDGWRWVNMMDARLAEVDEVGVHGPF